MPRLVPLLVLLAADDAFLGPLQLQPRDAENRVYSAVKAGHPSLPSACRKVPPQGRVEVARAAAAFARRYLASDAFKARYRKDWAAEEPRAPEALEARAAREAAEAQRQEEQGRRSLEELKARAASEPNPELKKLLQDAVAAQEAARKQLESPELQAQLAQGRVYQAEAAKEEHARQLAAYQADLEAWRKREDPKVLVRERLQRFRELARTVDFKAPTVERGGRRYFQREADERRASEWKLLYRLGPEVVRVLQDAASQLEKEL